MDRQELILSKEYWSTSIALLLWENSGGDNANYEYWEIVAEKIVGAFCMNIIDEIRNFDKADIERINSGIKQIIEKDGDRPTSEIIEILKMVHTPIGEFICQRDIEGESKCDNSCEHCQEYYKPLIEDRK